MKPVKMLFILALLIMVSTPVFAQKMAYVHSQRVLSEFEEYKGVQNKLSEIQNQYQAEYDQLVKEYQNLLDEVESQSLLLSPEKKQEKERLMQQKAMQIEKYKYEKLGPQGEIYKKQAELGQPVLDKINAVIKKIGEDESFDFIFDGAVGILYAKPAHDITQQVLDELNKNKSAGNK